MSLGSEFKILQITVISATLMVGCGDKKSVEIASPKKINFTWDSLADKFPKKNIQVFSFDADSLDLEDLPEVDSSMYKWLWKQVKKYDEDQEFSKLYYYSTWPQSNSAVFLEVTENDGINYSFDLLTLDSVGNVSNVFELANYYNSGGCWGTDRASLTNSILNKISVEQCYDEEENGTLIDSTIRNYQLDNGHFILRDSVVISRTEMD